MPKIKIGIKALEKEKKKREINTTHSISARRWHCFYEARH